MKKCLKIKEFEGFRVTNANGKHTLVDQIVEKFGMMIQDYVAREDFYVYPLDGIPHLILGVQWLYNLGNIHSNYQKLVMKVEVEGKEHTLQGIKDYFPQASSSRLDMVYGVGSPTCQGRVCKGGIT